jgi:hypothetical protein
MRVEHKKYTAMKVEYKNMEAIFENDFYLSNDKWMAKISLYNESINEYHEIVVPYEEINFIGDRNDTLKNKLLQKAIARAEELVVITELIEQLSFN